MFDTTLAAIVIFALTYAVLGFGALPPLRIDRTGAALVGAIAMVATGVLSPDAAIRAVDFQTLALLFGMMVVVAHLRIAGFFGWLSARMLRFGRTPARAVAIVVVLSAVTSALFVNDTACLLLTPLALETAAAFAVTPVPFLLAVAMGSNAGSVGTLVGNPQNMLVGSMSGISYTRFATVLAPVAVFSVLATVVALWLAFRRPLSDVGAGAVAPSPERSLRRGLWVKVVVVSALLLVALLAGANPAVAAMIAGAVLLVTRRIHPARVWVHIDWGLLVMFAGLFVVVRGIEVAGWTERGLAWVPSSAHGSLAALACVTTVVSNLVSNVPAVLVLRAWAASHVSPEAAWLVLAMASTLAGNLTLVGSVANLIVVEQARDRARISFWQYARVGVPLAIVTIVIGVAWVSWVVR